MGEGWGEGEARSVEACPQPMAGRFTIFIFLLWPPQRYSASCRPLRDYCEKRRSNQPRGAPPHTLDLPSREFAAGSGRRKCSAGACPQLGRPRQPPSPTFPVLRLVRYCPHNVIIMTHMFCSLSLRRGANVDSYRQPQLVHGTRTRQDMKNAKQMLLQTRTWPDDKP